uniref:Uncharacterized protein n=1 Tax=Timema bartmani TaxID=61472 RepID=A0A7R9F3N4_9NEOP|nr:unnamed protein product [Timema bartmani]
MIDVVFYKSPDIYLKTVTSPVVHLATSLGVPGSIHGWYRCAFCPKGELPQRIVMQEYKPRLEQKKTTTTRHDSRVRVRQDATY